MEVRRDELGNSMNISVISTYSRRKINIPTHWIRITELRNLIRKGIIETFYLFEDSTK